MQTYYAKSATQSRTMYVNVILLIVGILEMSEITNIVPADYHGLLVVIAGALNIALRTFTVRPVAFVGPNETSAVQVETLGPSRTVYPPPAA